MARKNSDERAQAAVDRVTAQLNRKAERVSEQLNRKAERVTEQINRKAEQQTARILRTTAAVDRAMDLWTRQAPTSRRPRYTRDQIAATAVALVDREGLDALSMRRLALELEAGTMTLYHYVRTKDELLALIDDAVMAEVLVPDDELPDDWRAAITAIAHRTRDAMVRHPWVFDVATGAPPGPNSVRHMEQSLRAVRSLPGTLDDRLDVIMAVDCYVFGHCLGRRGDESGAGAAAAMQDHLLHLVRAGHYPEIEALLAEHGPDELMDRMTAHIVDDRRFSRNLDRLLEGLRADLAP